MRLFFTLPLAVLAVPAAAQQAPKQPPRPVSVEAETTYLRSSGSSEQETFKGFFNLRYRRDAWAHEFRAEGINETDSQTGARTRERYLAMEKTSWNFTPRDYLFIKPQYEKDLQSAYEYQALLSAGYGHQFFKTEALRWNVDLGAGSRYSKSDVTRAVDTEAVGNLATRLDWQFRSGARFTETASVEAGEDNTIIRTRTAFIFTLTDVLGLSISYDTKHDNSEPRVNDTVLSFGLNYLLK